MKNIIYLVLILFYVCSCKNAPTITGENSGCNCDDLILDPLYNHFYIEDRKSPYTGICFKLNKNSDTIETINYNKGKVDGILTTYFESGRKRSETTFKKNKHDGPYREWNEAGELIFHGIYDNGTFDTTLVNKRK